MSQKQVSAAAIPLTGVKGFGARILTWSRMSRGLQWSVPVEWGALGAAFSDDGAIIGVAGANRFITFLDSKSGQLSSRIRTRYLPSQLFCTSGRRFVDVEFSVVEGKDQRQSVSVIGLIDPGLGKIEYSKETMGPIILHMAHTPSRDLIATTQGRDVKIWDSSLKVKGFIARDLGRDVSALTFSRDGCRVASGDDRAVTIWKTNGVR